MLTWLIIIILSESHLSPDAIVPVRTGSRIAALWLVGFDPLVAVIGASAVSVLTDHDPSLRSAFTRAGTLNTHTHTPVWEHAPLNQTTVLMPIQHIYPWIHIQVTRKTHSQWCIIDCVIYLSECVPVNVLLIYNRLFNNSHQLAACVILRYLHLFRQTTLIKPSHCESHTHTFWISSSPSMHLGFCSGSKLMSTFADEANWSQTTETLVRSVKYERKQTGSTHTLHTPQLFCRKHYWH